MPIEAMRVVKIDGFLVEIFDSELVVRGDKGNNKLLPGDKLAGGIKEEILKKAISIRELISTVCNLVRGSFEKLTPPDELTLEFGIKIVGESGIPVVAKTKLESNISIKATWKTDKTK